MFGHGWKDATATVVLAEHFVAAGTVAAGLPSHTRMVVEVHPADGTPPYRAKLTLSHLGLNLTHRRMNPPNQGDVLQVKYDPKHPEDLKVVLDDAHDRRKNAQRDRDRLDAALHAPVGSGASEPQTNVQVNVSGGDLPPGFDLAGILAQAGIDPAQAGDVHVVQHGVANAMGVPPHGAPQPPVVSAAMILATGAPATATVLSSQMMGPGPEPETTMVGVDLQVTTAAGSTYSVSNLYKVPNAKLARVVPGAVLPVKVHAANPQFVAVDWAAT